MHDNHTLNPANTCNGRSAHTARKLSCSSAGGIGEEPSARHGAACCGVPVSEEARAAWQACTGARVGEVPLGTRQANGLPSGGLVVTGRADGAGEVGLQSARQADSEMLLQVINVCQVMWHL